MRENNCHSKIQYTGKILFNTKSNWKISTDTIPFLHPNPKNLSPSVNTKGDTKSSSGRKKTILERNMKMQESRKRRKKVSVWGKKKRMLNDYINENGDLWGLKYMLKNIWKNKYFMNKSLSQELNGDLAFKS